MLVENTYGNNTKNMREHIKILKKLYPNIKFLGMDRYCAIKNAFYVDNDEMVKLVEIFRINAQKLVQDVQLVLDDEAMIGYRVRAEKKQKLADAGKPVPLAFIPRKPHPNGLLIYVASCLVNHAFSAKGLPYILDMLPHLAAGDTAPHDTLVQFKNRWTADSRPAFIGMLFIVNVINFN